MSLLGTTLYLGLVTGHLLVGLGGQRNFVGFMRVQKCDASYVGNINFDPAKKLRKYHFIRSSFHLLQHTKLKFEPEPISKCPVPYTKYTVTHDVHLVRHAALYCSAFSRKRSKTTMKCGYMLKTYYCQFVY